LKVLVYEGWLKVIPKPKKKPKKAVKYVKPRAMPRHSRAQLEDLPPTPEPEDFHELLRTFDWPAMANQYDVIITTYQVLKADLDVARAVPMRPRRDNVIYHNVDRPRSPLVKCEWYRVVMDEVQMVGGGKTE
jgi:E3 ubiquitin-protein ligase SHPRH